MKTFALFLLFTSTLLLTANAQITKGNWMVGGDAYFASTNYEYKDSESSDTKSNEIRINPNVGYFFIDKLSVGLQVNLSFTETGSGGSENRGRSYGLGPFMRYYFLDVDKQINVFAQANYLMRFGEKGDTENTIDWNGYGLKAGTVIFLNQSVGVELSLDYTSITQKANENKRNMFLVGLGLQIHLEKR